MAHLIPIFFFPATPPRRRHDAPLPSCSLFNYKAPPTPPLLLIPQTALHCAFLHSLRKTPPLPLSAAAASGQEASFRANRAWRFMGRPVPLDVQHQRPGFHQLHQPRELLRRCFHARHARIAEDTIFRDGFQNALQDHHTS